MALTAPDGRFLAVNAALCRFLRRDAATLLASCVQEVTHPDDLAADVEQGKRALAGEIDSFQQAKRYILPSGGIVWGLLTISISRDARGAPQHYVSQVEDITDRKTAEGELRRYAAQLQALTGRDPLTGLLNQRAFEVALDEELYMLRAGGNGCSVLLLEIDGDDRAVVTAADALARASRNADLSAHLGNGELAVLVPSVDAGTAAQIVARISGAVRRRGVRIAHATARSGESASALLRRLRESLPEHGGPVLGESWVRAPEAITRILELARSQLDTPIAFLTRMVADDCVFIAFAGDGQALRLGEGDTISRADAYCQRLLDNRMGAIVPDTTANPETQDLDLTSKMGLRAYAGAAVRLASGETYGTLGVVDTRAHPEFSERQAELLRFLGDRIAELIEDEDSNPEVQLTQTADTGVRTLLAALQARDFYTSSHSRQVVELAMAVAKRLGLDPQATRDVEQVALLHDIGKVGIPDAILQKQGPLDDDEWELMRQHPIVGEHIIAGTPGLSRLAPSIRAEHERWDGSGYPDGLAGEQIPLASRITLACDALNAMTSDRPYRQAMTLERAECELESCAGTQFDPGIIRVLLAEVAHAPRPSPLVVVNDSEPLAESAQLLQA
jgi:PAS domain S-box-containing protein